MQILKFAILFIALVILLTIGAVNLPYVHTILTKKTNSFLAEKGIPITVGKISLLLNGKIGIKQFEIISSGTDTLIYAGKASADVRLFPLLKKRVIVKNISLEDVVANITTDEQTGKINIISLFSKTEPDETLVIKDNTQTSVSWEIQVGKIDLKNIRFLYSDPAGGILIKQKIDKADLKFGYFSLLEQKIDLIQAEISKPEGMVAIWDTPDKTETETDTETTWKFSVKNLDIRNLLFELDQPDVGNQLKVSLKKGVLSLDKLNLGTQEIIVENIELNEPFVTFFTSAKTTKANQTDEGSAGFTLPEIPWTIQVEKTVIEDGFFTTSSGESRQDSSMDKWLPVHGLNVSFKNLLLTPSVYQLNLDKLSFSLAETIEIETGNISFNTDSRKNTESKVYLSAIINEKESKSAKNTKLELTAHLSGNNAKMNIHKLALQSSDGLNLSLSGQISQILELPESGCNIRFSSGAISRAQLATIVNAFSPETELPFFQPVSINGSIKNTILNPVFAVKINSNSGRIDASGNYSIKNSSGNLQASFNQVLLSNLFGETLPEKISGKISFKGGIKGTELPEGEAFIEIDSVLYKNKITRNIHVKAESWNKEAEITLIVADSAVNIDFSGHFAMSNQKEYSGDITGLFDIDFFALNLMQEPFAGKGKIDVDFEYLKTAVTASGGLKNFVLSNKKDTSAVGDVHFNLNMGDSIILSDIKSRFINAEFNSKASFSDFKNAYEATHFEKIINLDSANFLQLDAIHNLKSFKLEAAIQYDPVFNLFLPDSVLNFSKINIEIGKPETDSALRGTVFSEWLSYNQTTSYNPRFTGIISNDRLKLEFKHDSLAVPQLIFGKAAVNIDVLPSFISTGFVVSDISDSILYRIGFDARKENERVVFKSATREWIINKNPWILSLTEFLTWEKATQSLIAGLDLHYNNRHIGFKGKNSDTLALEINNIELRNLAIPGIAGYIPDGLIDVRMIYTKTKYHNVKLNMQMHQTKWKGLEFNLLSFNGNLTADTSGILNSELYISADDSLSVLVEMTSINAENEFQIKSKFSKLNLKIFEPFISEFANDLQGTSAGNVSINSKKGKMTLDGEIGFNNFGMKIIPLETRLTIPDNKIEITENRLLFNDFTIIDSFKRPLTVNGNIVFENIDNIWADLMVETNKIQLMNTSESENASFFGSVMVNSALNIKGPVFSPSINGNIELEDGTNVTYQLVQDLSVRETQNDIVFAVITDSLQVIYPETGLENSSAPLPNIETTIRINNKSIFNVMISDIYDVDITVGGEGLLNYNMLPNNTMSLNGVYEIKTGDCKLKITGWPLKNFKLTPGSSLQWDGNIENPLLNLEATTRVRGSYFNPIDNRSRTVDFIVSMQLKNKLSELEILFAIQSNDQYITSIINSMSEDEKMRQAINLLLFETIDIPGIERSGDYISSQINSFWESQLNSLSRSKLKNTDLSFGIDTYNQTNGTGNQERTSFTYEMEHRFMNDRAIVRLSGKLNDYNEGIYKTNSIFENFIFEYALDPANTKNLKLYQKRDYEDMLEGEVSKYGVGFLYRKNYSKFKDIWQRGKKQNRQKR